MKKGLGLMVLFWFVWTAAFVRRSSSNHGVVYMDSTAGTQFEEFTGYAMEARYEAIAVTLEDYRPIDPIPSSTNSIRPGPIEHGTPLLPYIPEHAPPPSHKGKDGPP